MMMHKALYPKDDINRRYVSRKEGERRLAVIKDFAAASIREHYNCTKKANERLITAARSRTDNMGTNGTTKHKKQKWE